MTARMNWQDHFTTNPRVLVGKPVIKGTRLAVEFILALMSRGCSEKQITTNYHLAPEQVRACLAYAHWRLADEKASPAASNTPTRGRITADPLTMGGKPCIRGLRVTVGTIVGLMASNKSRDEILGLHPYLEAPDIDAALQYAAWRVQEG